MKQMSLFEVENIPIEIQKPRSKYQQWKYDNKYRKADSEKRCKNCKHILIKQEQKN